MAQVVLAKRGERPPESGDRIVIVRNALARTCKTTTWCGDIVVYHPNYRPLEQALEEATATIYVRGTGVHRPRRRHGSMKGCARTMRPRAEAPAPQPGEPW
jgi:hypothetical protein